MRYLALSFALLLGSGAYAVPPSDASIQELMRVMDTQKTLDLVFAQMDAAMQAGVQSALKGQEITPDTQTIVDNMRTKMLAVYREEMSWPVMEPLFTDLYRRTFTQAEIDGMLAFYKSDTGRAVTAKMPLVMQNSMQTMQQRMEALMPRLKKIQEEMVADIKAAACRQKCGEAK